MYLRAWVFVFFVIVGASFWLQRRYMEISSQEFKAETSADRSRAQILRMDKFVALYYKNSSLSSSVKANQGELLNNGDLLLEGNVKYQDYGADTLPRVGMSAERASCKLQVSDPNQNFFDTTRRLETIFLPNEVLIKVEEDFIKTRDVTLNLKEDFVETKAAVSLVGPGRVLDATGMTYHLTSERFTLGKRVNGYYVPVGRPSKTQ